MEEETAVPVRRAIVSISRQALIDLCLPKGSRIVDVIPTGRGDPRRYEAVPFDDIRLIVEHEDLPKVEEGAEYHDVGVKLDPVTEEFEWEL